jgi:hypothetical protein
LKTKSLVLRTARGKRKGAKLEEIEEREWRNASDVNRSLKKKNSKNCPFFPKNIFHRRRN